MPGISSANTLKRKLAAPLAAAALIAFAYAEALAQEPRTKPPSKLVTEQHVPRPSQQIYERWVQDFFETDEVWRFKDRQEYEGLIDSSSIAPSLKQSLKTLYKDRLSPGEAVKATSYNLRAAGGYVFIPRSLRSQVPTALVERAYTYLEHREGPIRPGALHSSWRRKRDDAARSAMPLADK